MSVGRHGQLMPTGTQLAFKGLQMWLRHQAPIGMVSDALHQKDKDLQVYTSYLGLMAEAWCVFEQSSQAMLRLLLLCQPKVQSIDRVSKHDVALLWVSTKICSTTRQALTRQLLLPRDPPPSLPQPSSVGALAALQARCQGWHMM